MFLPTDNCMGASSPVIKSTRNLYVRVLGILLESLFWSFDFFIGWGAFLCFCSCLCNCLLLFLWGLVFVVVVVIVLHNFAPIFLSSVLPRFESLRSTAQGGHTFFN